MEERISVWRRSLMGGSVGVVAGVVLFHPAAMFIMDYYGPTPHINWGGLQMAFSRQHLPMTIFYGILGAFIGALHGFLNAKLTKSKKRLGLLEGILRICCVCKRIRDEQADETHPPKWVEVADYISLNSDAQFSHAYCPDCHKQVKEELHTFRTVTQRKQKNPAQPYFLRSWSKDIGQSP